MRALSTVALAVVLNLIYFAGNAAAHLVTTGMGPVYDGIGHLLLTPEDMIPATAIALYAGLGGKSSAKCSLLFFPMSWLLGGCIGMMTNTTPSIELSALSFLLLGTLIAADLHLPDKVFNLLVKAKSFKVNTCKAGG